MDWVGCPTLAGFARVGPITLPYDGGDGRNRQIGVQVLGGPGNAARSDRRRITPLSFLADQCPQIVRSQACVLGDLRHHDGADFVRILECLCVSGIAAPLRLNVRAALFFLRRPADAEESFVDPACLTARPFAHEKWIDLGGLRICSVRSAMTRKASAVTATSASFLVFP